MEVKAGYKQTEVGVIPVDWEIKKIESVCQIFGRIGFRGYTINDIVKAEQGALTLSPSNILDNAMDFSKCTYISWYKYEESPEIKIYNGDILLVKTGSTYGKTALVRDLKEKATINPQIVVLKMILISNQYLGYMMGFKIIQDQIATAIVGGAIPTLSQKQISNFKFPLPPTKSEQTDIATALSDTDALISSLEKLIAKKKMIKQGAMQELLKPKEGWEVKKLGECLLKNPDYGINAAAVEFDDTLPTYLRITDISDNGKYLHANKVSVNNVNSDSYYLDEGDIVFARTGASVGKTYLYDKNDGKLVFAGFLIRLRSNPKILFYKYLFYITQTKAYWSWVLANSMRSGQPGINSNEYKSYEISLPNLPEQKRIANILADMDSEINALDTKLGKYKMIKQGMMQELLTGKIRLI